MHRSVRFLVKGQAAHTADRGSAETKQKLFKSCTDSRRACTLEKKVSDFPIPSQGEFA
jgi:hypothetical protein